MRIPGSVQITYLPDGAIRASLVPLGIGTKSDKYNANYDITNKNNCNV
jgi:hypothetical protein